jgi:hypothetical protein
MSRRPQGRIATLAALSPGAGIYLGRVSSSPRSEPITGDYPGLLTRFWPLEERSDLHDGGRGHFHVSAGRIILDQEAGGAYDSATSLTVNSSGGLMAFRRESVSPIAFTRAAGRRHRRAHPPLASIVRPWVRPYPTTGALKELAMRHLFALLMVLVLTWS